MYDIVMQIYTYCDAQQYKIVDLQSKCLHLKWLLLCNKNHTIHSHSPFDVKYTFIDFLIVVFII